MKSFYFRVLLLMHPLLLLSLFLSAQISCDKCKYVVELSNKDVPITDVTSVVPDFAAGDTIGIRGGSTARDYLVFSNFISPDPSKPYVFLNCSGDVIINSTYSVSAIAFRNCKYFRITGAESSTYGIRIVGKEKKNTSGVTIGYAPEWGLQVGDLSSDAEVDHISVSQIHFAAFSLKTDPECDKPATWRENFTMRNLKVHHNYVNKTWKGEGFYIGYSFYSGAKGCPTRKPHDIENLHVYENETHNTGADGMQVGCAVSGSSIHNNRVYDYGINPFNGSTQEQGNGIQLGDGTAAPLYNNYIQAKIGATTGGGIKAFGASNLIYNNIIVNPYELGIYVDEGSGTLALNGSGFRIYNNTIVNCYGSGVVIYADSVTMNRVKNNIMVRNPEGSGRFIHFLKDKPPPIDSANNFETKDYSAVKFTNTTDTQQPWRKYELSSESPCLDTGVNLYAAGVTKDFLGRSRPSNTAVKFDQGVYEYGTVIDPPEDPDPTSPYTIRINFRSTLPPPPGTQWNDWNVTPTTVGQAISLSYTSGVTTNYTAAIAVKFSGGNDQGVNAAGIYPLEINRTNWYLTDGQPAGKVTISNLNQAKKYTFTFFGSRRQTNPPYDRRTEYTINSRTVILDAADNTSDTVKIVNVSPVGGAISFTVKNVAGAPFGYLSAVEIEEFEAVTTRVMKMNFRKDPPGSPTGYNDILANPTTAGRTFDTLEYTDGSVSTYKLTLINKFSGGNDQGMVSTAGIHPADVIKTNWYVADEVTPPAEIRISGLDDQKRYTLNIFGSRKETDPPFSRRTIYTINGVSKTVDCSNNYRNAAPFPDIPSSNGEIRFTVKAEAGAPFAYLNALEIIEKTITSGSGFASAEVSEMSTEEDVSAHPVPMEDVLNITFNKSMEGEVEIRLVDLNGTSFFTKGGYFVEKGTMIPVDLRPLRLRRGIYILKVRSSSGEIENIRMSKE
jgi:hypothetical protein